MRSMLTLAAMMSLLLVAAGCGSQGGKSDAASPEAAGAAETPRPAGEGHADAAVVAGSHEDWCDEHMVPESQCTRCDPSLIPAFQAANDWCADHGLPMSQCTIHDPNLKIVRPPAKEGQ
jgi:hypothetical protein